MAAQNCNRWKVQHNRLVVLFVRHGALPQYLAVSAALCNTSSCQNTMPESCSTPTCGSGPAQASAAALQIGGPAARQAGTAMGVAEPGS